MKFIRNMAIGVTLLALCAAASAKPVTTLLDPLKVDLQARSAGLKGLTDVASRVRRLVVKAALSDLKDPSKSVTDDLKILKLIAAKIERAYAVNDPALLAAVDAFVVRVTADRDAAAAKMPTVLNAHAAADAQDLLDAASATIVRVTQRPLDLDTVKLRAGALRTASKQIASAQAKIRRGSACDPRLFGLMRMDLDLAAENPTYGHATFSYFNGTSDIAGISLQGYWYDRRAADPYERGAYDISFNGPAFHGVGTYTFGVDAGLGRSEHLNYWRAVSGTVEVTAFDEAKKTISGTFSCQLREVVSNATAEVTTGMFSFCSWQTNEIAPPKR